MSLELTGVSHRYRHGPEVLRGVDLTVEPGATVALVGPSGSGKTTLASILGGLLRPTAGAVRCDGRRVGGRGHAPGAVAWVFQTIEVFAVRTVIDNAALGALARGAKRAEAFEAARAALGAVGLDGFEQRRASTLSGGEAQRVGIARAIAGAPPYMVADEPTGQLDRTTSQRVGHALFDARPASTALVLSTHDLDMASRCARVLTIVDGRLEEA